MISGGIHQFGDEKLRFLVIPKYATSLEAIREKRKTFTQNEVWTIARCMLESLEYIHEKVSGEKTTISGRVKSTKFDAGFHVKVLHCGLI